MTTADTAPGRCLWSGLARGLFLLLMAVSPAAAQYPSLMDWARDMVHGTANDRRNQDTAAFDQPGTDAPTAEVRVSERGTIELHVANLPLSTVLQLLSLDGRWNIITSPRVKGTVTANLYDVSFEQALRAVLAPNGATFVREGNFIHVYTVDELADLELAANPPRTRVFPLSYISAADAESYITTLLSNVGKIAASPSAERGIGSSADDAGGFTYSNHDFIIVTDRPVVLDRIEAVLRQIDVRPTQVLIEATILRAQLNQDNALGIDFTVLGGVDLELLNATSGGITDVALGNLPVDRFELFNSNLTTDFRNNVPAGGMTLGIIKDHVAVFVRALEQVTDTSVLANPKVLALNKQRGQVIVGRRDGYLTTTVTETQAIQTVEFLETGTQLVFRPLVGNDGYVRVELHPEDSVGFVNAQGLPTKQTTEVTTNVIVRDGQTILIGGLFRDVATNARAQVPLLGSIPGLGNLFGSRTETTSREEVIILLTIHVIKDDAAFAEASRNQLEQIERMRAGMRQGMMWTGRDRLADGYFREALNHYGKGNTDRALWHLKMSLHCRPRYLPAIQLRETILGKRAWQDDGSATRNFVHEMIAVERGTTPVMFDRPSPKARLLPGPTGFEDVPSPPE